MAAATPDDGKSLFRLSIPEDGMRVTLEWTAKERGLQRLPAVLAELQKASITEGVCKEALEKFLAEKKGPGSFALAQGTAPKQGLEGGWQSFFDLTPKRVPEHLLDGSVDYHHVRAFIEVREGQPLARKIPPIPGIPGKTCLGKEIPAPAPKDPAWTLGEGTEFEPERPDYVIATRRGVLQMREGRLCVATEIAIRGSVDFQTGDIDVSVPITISEDIEPGFFVRSSANVTVGGCIQSSRVECGGDLKVGGGILGEPFSTIFVGGNLRARYAQNARIEVRGDCQIDKMLKGVVIACGNSLQVGDCLVASRALVGTKAQIGTLGAEADHESRLVMGTRGASLRRLFRIEAELWEIENRLRQNSLEHAENRQAIAMDERAEGSRSAQKTFTSMSAGGAELRRSAAEEGALRARQDKLLARRREILETNVGLAGPSEIAIEKAAFLGSEICFGNRSWKLAADLSGRRRIVRETLRRAPLNVLALGDNVFQKEMQGLAEAADLWSLRAAAPEASLQAQLRGVDFVFLQGARVSPKAVQDWLAAAEKSKDEQALALVFTQGMDEASLATLPQTPRCVQVPDAEQALATLDSSSR